MPTPTLGRLERVDLREVWSSESGDFTPWLALADNLAILADTIGLDLELQAQEQRVGLFRDEWATQHKWLADTVEKFFRVFQPRVKQLNVVDEEEDADTPG